MQLLPFININLYSSYDYVIGPTFPKINKDIRMIYFFHSFLLGIRFEMSILKDHIFVTLATKVPERSETHLLLATLF